MVNSRLLESRIWRCPKDFSMFKVSKRAGSKVKVALKINGSLTGQNHINSSCSRTLPLALYAGLVVLKEADLLGLLHRHFRLRFKYMGCQAATPQRG
jgi:hypothetical protein